MFNAQMTCKEFNMKKYTATFADGTSITRKSARGYAVAWRATWINLDGRARTETGFSATAQNAAASARPSLPYGTWRGMSSKDRAFAGQQNAQFLANANLRVEIAPAIAAKEA
jgi:hypothetical protein